MSAIQQNQHAPIKCLIVDDLEENLVALSAVLRDLDVELLTARSGLHALELLLAHDVALALVDVQMPDMDGFELAELMRGTERTRRVPIIFVTAGARDQQRVFRGYESGAVDFLFKPVEAHVLRSKAEVFFRLERQNRQLARQLEERTETLRLNEVFTGVLGHDLRGPLTAILMAAKLLSRSETEATQKLAERITRSAQWMGRMVEDTLDLTRARVGGGIAIRPAWTELDIIVERAVQDRQSASPDRVVTMAREGDLNGHWDADRLAQVALNLVGNAFRHGDPATPVELHLDGRDAAQVVLFIRNGGAIGAEVLPSIFDPFRSGRQGSGADGLGLGLYIVQQIVLAHGGVVAVEAEVGATGFRVTLPRVVSPSE